MLNPSVTPYLMPIKKNYEFQQSYPQIKTKQPQTNYSPNNAKSKPSKKKKY